MNGAVWHGGVPGLGVGDTLVPSPPLVTDGCPVCVARSEGRIFTIGEFREWMAEFPPERSRSALAAVAGAPDWMPLDPPSETEAVYVTASQPYARWYAAKGRGDLYQVQPIGGMDPSPTDNFPTWMVGSARVVAVVERCVRLKRPDRRALAKEWAKADRHRTER